MTIIFHASLPKINEWKGPKRYVRVIIHETRDELQKAVHKFSPGDWPEDVMGAYHPPFHRELFDIHLKKWVNTTRKHWGGVIRMSLEDLSTDVISHEIVHAACAIFRMDVYPAVSLGKDCNYKEEHLAYIIGNLHQEIVNELYEHGVWKAKDEFDART